MKRSVVVAAVATAMAIGVSASAGASELTYRFNNPSFGGNPFNSDHLLGVATAQDDNEDPNAPTFDDDPGSQFVRNLEARLLSSLAGDVDDAIFGDPSDPGTLQPGDTRTLAVGDTIVTIERTADSAIVTVFNATDGSTSTVEIPVL